MGAAGMRRLLTLFRLVTLATLGFSCAAGSGGASGPETYRERLGQATPYDFARYTRQIMERYHFEIERSDSTESQHVIRTRWQHRYPFEDEQAVGAVDAMTRFIIQARSRGGVGAAGASNLSVVEFVAENQLLMGDPEAWRRDILTAQYRDYLREITQALKTEFSTGIRVY